MRDRIFFSICFGFIFGVLLQSFLSPDTYLAIEFSIISFFLIIFFSLVSRNNWAIIFSCFVLAFCLGILRLQAREFAEFNIYDSGGHVSITGIVVDAPDIREDNQKLTVEEDMSGILTKILVTTSLGENYRYGDEVRVAGNIEKPENFITDQGKVFDYVNYLKKDRILYVINYGDIEILSRGHGNKVKSALFDIKNKFLEKINLAVRSPENLLLGGLILGEKSAFSDDLRQSFIDTGTIHIVALSGYNITIVSEWFMKLFSFLPQNFAIGAGIFAISLFILMTGASSTALRAGVMATLALYARASGRNYDVARALLCAGVIMIFINPMILAFDVSFQLSFLATIALIFFTPKIEKYFLWVPKRGKLRDVVTVTFAVYLFVLPFILYKMGNLSLVALPANILVLPLIPLTMVAGFLTGFLGLINYFLSVPMGFVSYFLLHYELGAIKTLSSVPFAAVTIPNFPLWLTILIYAVFIYKLFGRVIKEIFTRELS